MLSITGLTLEQFASLMEGLGYRAEKGERPKVKAAVEAAGEPVVDDAGSEAFVSGTGDAPVEPQAAAPAQPIEPFPEPEVADAKEGMPRPLDAVITEEMPGDALDDAPAATAYAEADTAAIEAVEQGATDVDQAPERPASGDAVAVTEDGAASGTAAEPAARDSAPRVEATDEPMAAMSQPSSVPKEAEGKQVEVSVADAATGEMETFYTFRILPRGRRQRGDQNQNRNEGGGNRRRQPKTEGGERPERNEGGAKRKQGGKGKPRGGKPGQQDRQPRRDHSAAPPRPTKPMDPDSPFAILQKLKDGK
jgi:ATP-dependent RNA helicase SUPV3L1/SUV3